MIDGKKVLDACCGGRMCWFDKQHPETVYIDNRTHFEELTNGQIFSVFPDSVRDFRDNEFPDNAFALVLFDPPHTFAGPNSWLTKKYGRLNRRTWKEDIARGFVECFRVLRPDGTLIFKWNEEKVTLSDVLALSPYKPLFGHRSGRSAKTIWVTFLKTEESRRIEG